MGEIIATCGHRISENWLYNRNSQCITKSQTRDGSPALSYSTQCLDCRIALDKAGVLFRTSADADRWLSAESEKI